MVLFLSRKDVELVLTMKDAIDAVEDGFREHGLGTVNMPLRSVIRVAKHNGAVLFMPASIEAMGALGVKVVSVYSDNPSKHNLPTTQGIVLLSDPENGAILAIMDGTFLTAIRTGAASAVATKYLAKKDAKTVGLIGTGVQGRAQIQGVCEVREIQKVKAFDIIPDRCSSFCKEISRELEVDAVPVSRPELVVKGSEIVATSSTSKTPVLNGDWLAEGAHVNAIGSHTPDARELDATAIRRAKVIVDSREVALKEAGDIMIPISQGIISSEHIFAELGEIITGKKAGREGPNEITIFKSQGLAIQDVSTANKIYELARKKGVGKVLTL
jgi:ornithine cyclodeaminase/alanine dehydrogenase